MKAIFGSPSKTTQSSQQGYSALSPALQAAFDPLGTELSKYTNPANPGVTGAFTPAPLSGAENTAVGNINAGFAPTAGSVNSDMALQMNPYNDSVINEINRQGQGQFSVLKQAMDNAGQTDSNRTLLGANDIDLSRQNLIGQFLSGQFNTSMGNALTTLPNARFTDANNQISIGDMLRNLDMSTKQAPVNAALTGIGGIAPFTAGGTEQSKSTGATTGLLGYAAQIASGAKYSDRRLKENIRRVGQENGHNVYEFNYGGMDQKYIGVMADEVQKTHPEAVVTMDNGFMGVDYGKIGVKFREANARI